MFLKLYMPVYSSFQKRMSMSKKSKISPSFCFCDGTQCYSVDIADLPLLLSIQEEEAVRGMCFGNHKHIDFVTFNLRKDIDTLTLLQFCSLISNTLTPGKDTLVRFDRLSFLLDYFCASAFLSNKLKEISWSPTNDIVTAMTIFQVWDCCNETFPSIDIMGLVEFPLLLRLRFILKYNDSDFLMPTVEMCIQTAHDQLQIPLEILRLLSSTDAVIAGGAASYLADAGNSPLPTSDVDIFVFDNNNQKMMIDSITQALSNSNRVVCKSGPSVLTAIGTYGTKSIQVIATTAKNAEELVLAFDLNLAKAFYDGVHVRFTASAQHDWMTKTCSNGTFTHIKPTRLAKAYLKGFQLNDAAIEYLKNTIKWPLCPQLIAKLVHRVPCLIPGVPYDVQMQQLLRMNLQPLNYTQQDKELVALGNSYGPQGIFTGDANEFVSTLSVCQKKIHSYIFNRFKREFLIALPVCFVPFTQTPEGKYAVKKICIKSKPDQSSFAVLHDVICAKFGKGSLFRDQEYPDINVVFSTQTVWFKQGIQLQENIELQKNSTVKCIALVRDIMHDTRRNKEWLRFNIVKAFIC
jgi:hypothetical protein